MTGVPARPRDGAEESRKRSTALGIRRIASLAEPFILALIATVVLATVFPPTGIGVRIIDRLAVACIVLLFFIHGAKLSRAAIVEGAKNVKLHAATLATTFLIFPAAGLLIRSTGLLAPPLDTGMVFLTLLPSTVQSSIAFTSIAGGNVAAAICSASLSNLIGIAATPVLASLTIDAHRHAFLSLASIGSISLQLLLPFAVGHALRPVVKPFFAREKRLVALVDRGSVLIVVYSSFGASVNEGIWYRVSPDQIAMLVVICAVLLGAVIAFTWALSRLLRFDRPDAIALQFCGSKKSLVSGVPIAAVLFPAASIGAIILPLMVFHQLQLIACALIARRYAAASPDATEAAERSSKLCRRRSCRRS